MLVLAMEFSRGALRGHRTWPPENRPAAGWISHGRAAVATGSTRADGVASRAGSLRGARTTRIRRSLPQNGIVMPPGAGTGPQAVGRDTQACAVRRGGSTDDSE
jgi:hypothetical protein